MNEEKFLAVLKKNRKYITADRIRLFEVLGTLKSPCTVNALVSKVGTDVDSVTVYRNIDLYEKLGIVTRVYSKGKYLFELSDQFSPHHHHMTCTNCGVILKFQESPAFIHEMQKIENKFGFKSSHHTVELSGFCSNCC